MAKWCKQRTVSVPVARFTVKGEYLGTFCVFSPACATLGWRALEKQKFKSANIAGGQDGSDSRTTKKARVLLFPGDDESELSELQTLPCVFAR